MTRAGAALDLFSGPVQGPDGLQYVPEFLDRDEERALLDVIATLPLAAAKYKAYTARRRTLSYGASYDFDENELQPAAPVPAFLHPLRERVAAHVGHAAAAFEHVLITEYRPGTQLGWHRDVPDFETVVGISLAGRCRMRFRPYPPEPRSPRAFALELAPRSLYVLAREMRWRWQHAVPPTPELRYSITLRTRSERRRR